MQPFTEWRAVVAPLDRPNIDTDQIIPKQFLKSIVRSGLGRGLFFDWRFLADGSPNPRFALNQAPFKGAGILLARENFGCGSSREHAAWALEDFGIRALIAPSFADIFAANCYQNGLLPVTLPVARIEELFRAVTDHPGLRARIDLPAQTVSIEGDGPWSAPFAIDPDRKARLLEGADEIALTLRHETAIAAYEMGKGLPAG